MPKTAEQMNAERRAAKARQNQAARAKALGNRGQQGEFSITDALKERKLRERRLQRSAEQGQLLLERLKSQKSMQISADTHGKNWYRVAMDLLQAAKADEGRYVWDKNWRSRERLLIAVKK